MAGLSEHDIWIFVSQLGLIILAARLFGEIAQRLGQPIIVGEVFAGIVLGPSIFGQLLPNVYHHIFPANGVHDNLLQGLSWLCVLFLLLITGLEIDTSSSIRHGRRNVMTALLGLIFPFFGLMFYSFYFIPAANIPEGVDPLHFRLVLASALSVVAIPVIGKILFDLKILRSFVGLNIITSGVISDIIGWAVVMAVVSIITKGTVSFWGYTQPIVVLLIFMFISVAYGRKLTDLIFELFNIKSNDTTAIIQLLFAGALINGALVHLFGIHVIFGAFLAGIMVGESKYMTHYMRQSTQDFIFGIFAPIFFVLIGMQLDFSQGFDWGLILPLLGVATVFKIFGGYLGAMMGGIGQRNALAVACGLNTQGTMGIIIALIGVDIGVFDKEMFGGIVLICVLTSLFVGPLLKWAIGLVRSPLAQYFDRDHVFLDVPGWDKKEVVDQMCILMEKRGIIKDAEFISENIWTREKTLSTAIGDGVALPHARIENCPKPVLCFFRLKEPIEYDSPDQKPVQLLFLELTDSNDHGMQLNLISQVARLVSNPRNKQKLLTCQKEEDVHHIMSFDEKV